MHTDVFDDGKVGAACGVPYEWELAGPDGASFELRPIKGVHTLRDVVKAKRALRVARDVVRITVFWKKATAETCICAECLEHISDDEGRREYCHATTNNLDGVCDDCRVYWSIQELREAVLEAGGK